MSFAQLAVKDMQSHSREATVTPFCQICRATVAKQLLLLPRFVKYAETVTVAQSQLRSDCHPILLNMQSDCYGVDASI